jgi:hypothetical protein
MLCARSPADNPSLEAAGLRELCVRQKRVARPSPALVYRACTAVSEPSGRQTGTGALDSLGGPTPRLEGGPE